MAKALRISRTTLDVWIEKDDLLKSAIESQNESNIDWVEGKLFELIQGVTIQTFNSNGEPNIYTQPPNVTAIIFFLKTKGKGRGYVERHEFTGKDGEDLIPISSIKVVHTNAKPA